MAERWLVLLDVTPRSTVDNFANGLPIDAVSSRDGGVCFPVRACSPNLTNDVIGQFGIGQLFTTPELRNGHKPVLAVLSKVVDDRVEDFLCGTPGPSSVVKRLPVYPGYLSPFGQRQGSSLMSQYDVVSSVSELFFHRCPPAIRWLVIPVDVDTVNTVLGCWARPHVSIELLEGTPLGANCDSSAAINGKEPPTRVTAPSPHFGPDAIFRYMRQAVSGMCTPNTTVRNLPILDTDGRDSEVLLAAGTHDNNRRRATLSRNRVTSGVSPRMLDTSLGHFLVSILPHSLSGRRL